MTSTEAGIMKTIARTAILAAALAATALAAPGTAAAQEPLRVVTTLPVYADIVEFIGGDQVEVTSIANPNEDAHFVRPKPSFALELRRADAFVTTGLDLELWVPTLLDRAGNQDVIEGGQGYITAYPDIELLDIPETADRSAGDVHIYGNPHLTTDPLRTLQVARNITAGLRNADASRASTWDAGLERFQTEIWNRLFGEEIVGMLGGHALERLALNGNLFSFLEEQEYDGRRLSTYLGGWLARAEPFRGGEMICYHKNWAYFEDRFQVTCADYVEAKPGIPPTPGHVARLIDRMKNEALDVLLAASYFDRGQVSTVAERGGATMVMVPLQPGAMDGVDSYFDVVDVWVDELARAFRDGS